MQETLHPGRDAGTYKDEHVRRFRYLGSGDSHKKGCLRPDSNRAADSQRRSGVALDASPSLTYITSKLATLMVRYVT